MPNSPALWMAVGMLWIMDASINISMEPFRAFVGDVLILRTTNQRFCHAKFVYWSGSNIASFMPWIFKNWLAFLIELLKEK
jgi:maltose/moltooligosaccharide transporter